MGKIRVRHLHLADRRLSLDALAFLVLHHPRILTLFDRRVRARPGSVGGSRSRTAIRAVEVLMDDMDHAGMKRVGNRPATTQIFRALLGRSLVGIIVILALFVILSGGIKSLALSWTARRVDLQTVLLLNLTKANLSDIVRHSVYDHGDQEIEMEGGIYLGGAWVFQVGVLGDLDPIDYKSVSICFRASRAALKEPFARLLRVETELKLTGTWIFVEADNVEEEQALNRSKVDTILLVGRVDGGLGAGLSVAALGSNAITVLLRLERCVGVFRHCCVSVVEVKSERAE